MSYIRVIPRDLFNESKLLKCLGALYIESERGVSGLRCNLHVVFDDEGEQAPFLIDQDENTGAIFVRNVTVTYKGRLLHCYTGLNARDAYPMYAECGDDCVVVFTDAGKLSEEFLTWIPKESHE